MYVLKSRARQRRRTRIQAPLALSSCSATTQPAITRWPITAQNAFLTPHSASLSLRSRPTNEGVELKKRRRKFPLNTCVHSDSKAVGRRRGASRDGPSGAMSAAAGNCGPCPTRCKGTLSVVTRPLPMVPSRVGGLSATPRWYIPGQNCFISRAPCWWGWGTADIDACGPFQEDPQRVEGQG